MFKKSLLFSLLCTASTFPNSKTVEPQVELKFNNADLNKVQFDSTSPATALEQLLDRGFQGGLDITTPVTNIPLLQTYGGVSGIQVFYPAGRKDGFQLSEEAAASLHRELFQSTLLAACVYQQLRLLPNQHTFIATDKHGVWRCVENDNSTQTSCHRLSNQDIRNVLELAEEHYQSNNRRLSKGS